jgi:hypothetical protein
VTNAEHRDHEANGSDYETYDASGAVGHVSPRYDTWRREHFLPSSNFDVRPNTLIDLPTIEIRIAKAGEKYFENRE